MSVKQIKELLLPALHHNTNLNKYDNSVLFPAKVALAKASLTTISVAKLRAIAKK